MRILLVGGTGHVGSAVRTRLERDHEVLVASRSSEIPVDTADPDSITAMYRSVGQVDAVVVAVGAAPFRPLAQLSRDDFLGGFVRKSLGQIEVVRQGIDHVTDGGSFTLTSGIVGREQVRTGVASAVANGALEHFVKAAAVELPRGIRINVISPTVLAEAPSYHSAFPGFRPIAAATMAEFYLRSVAGVDTGRVYLAE